MLKTIAMCSVLALAACGDLPLDDASDPDSVDRLSFVNSPTRGNSATYR